MPRQKTRHDMKDQVCGERTILIRLGSFGGSSRILIKMHLPQANNLAPDTINKTNMTRKGWYAHITDECSLFARTLIRAVIGPASVYGLNGFVEIAADSKTRTKSLGLSLSTMFGKNAAAE